jgi:hypothetical protein
MVKLPALIKILLAFILGTILAGCACPPKGQLTLAVHSIYYIEQQLVELKVEYDVFSDTIKSRNR